MCNSFIPSVIVMETKHEPPPPVPEETPMTPSFPDVTSHTEGDSPEPMRAWREKCATGGGMGCDVVNELKGHLTYSPQLPEDNYACIRESTVMY